jgi:Glycogen synthase
MEERGISLLYGRWLIEGAPRVLLIDTGTGYRWLDEWKGDLWAAAGIPSPAGDSETNEAIVFGYLVAWFLGEVSCKRSYRKEQKLTKPVHCQRAISSGHCALPRVARRCCPTLD